LTRRPGAWFAGIAVRDTTGKEVRYMDVTTESIPTSGRARRLGEVGQGLAEYALILALIAVLAIIALMFLGSQISDRLSQVGNAM
jgi:Flp pilus assembly pilin Flp